MQAGQLRHRVEIQRATESVDSYNEVTRTWGTIATRWAKVHPLRGDERVAAQKMESQTSHVITIRGELDVIATDRVKWGSRIFNITAVVNMDERDIMREIHATEVDRTIEGGS